MSKLGLKKVMLSADEADIAAEAVTFKPEILATVFPVSMPLIKIRSPTLALDTAAAVGIVVEATTLADNVVACLGA
jgi:CMP-N-acetylneuraminic acid synthetase